MAYKPFSIPWSSIATKRRTLKLTQQQRSFYESNGVALHQGKNLSSSRVWFGWLTLGCYFLWWISPSLITPTLRIITSCFAIVWCLLAYTHYKVKVTLNIAVCFALLLQVWSVFTSIWASYNLGRNANLGRAELLWMEHLLPFFIANALIYLDPKATEKFIKLAIITFSISAFIAWLQFFKVPPGALLARYYTYKDIDFWDGTAGLRAVGLTFHPVILAIQSLFALALYIPRLAKRSPAKIDFAVLFLFSGAIVFSQARALLPALAVCWLVVIALLARSYPKMATMVTVWCALLAIVALLVGQNRLGYMLQSTSLSEDASYQFRARNIWIQLDPIAKAFPITGIGPSSGLLLGTGPEDKWVPIGRVMESAYKLFQAMYGIVGLSALVVGLSLSALVCLSKVVHSIAQKYESMAFTGLIVVSAIAIASYTGNTFDGYFTAPCAFAISAFVKRNWNLQSD